MRLLSCSVHSCLTSNNTNPTMLHFKPPILASLSRFTWDYSNTNLCSHQVLPTLTYWKLERLWYEQIQKLEVIPIELEKGDCSLIAMVDSVYLTPSITVFKTDLFLSPHLAIDISYARCRKTDFNWFNSWQRNFLGSTIRLKSNNRISSTYPYLTPHFDFQFHFKCVSRVEDSKSFKQRRGNCYLLMKNISPRGKRWMPKDFIYTFIARIYAFNWPDLFCSVRLPVPSS